MKSRTSFFNFTVFKKDITRFAPCWGLYTVMLLLGLFSLSNSSDPIDTATSIETLFSGIAPINMCYGLITATLLFGDLYNSRLCNALHAMPLRRESWFLTHVLSGLVFSLIPNIFIYLLALPILSLGGVTNILAWLLLAATLQYLFFFGLAVLCAMLTGNRFAHIVVCGILNLGAALVYELVVALYQPMLHGIQPNAQAYYTFSPVTYLLMESNLVQVLFEKTPLVSGDGYAQLRLDVILGEGWGYLTAYALVGIGALVLGLALYRRRKLECAGDFLAFRAAEPVFLVILSLFVGIVLMLFAEIFVDISTRYVFLYLGLGIGFFGGLMLLRRTTRVFRPRALAGMALIAAVLNLSIFLTEIDAFGIVRWVPKPERVASISFGDGTSPLYDREFSLPVEDPQDIQILLQAHRSLLEETPDFAPDQQLTSVHFQYKLKSGRTVNRYYDLRVDSEAGKLLRPYFSSIECVLGITEAEIPLLAGTIHLIETDNYYDILFSDSMRPDDPTDSLDIEDLDIEGLLRAIVADCKAGNMAQVPGFYLITETRTMDGLNDIACELSIFTAMKDGDPYSPPSKYYQLLVYDCSENTLAWLTENGLYPTENTAK